MGSVKLPYAAYVECPTATVSSCWSHKEISTVKGFSEMIYKWSEICSAVVYLIKHLLSLSRKVIHNKNVYGERGGDRWSLSILNFIKNFLKGDRTAYY